MATTHWCQISFPVSTGINQANNQKKEVSIYGKSRNRRRPVIGRTFFHRWTQFRRQEFQCQPFQLQSRPIQPQPHPIHEYTLIPLAQLQQSAPSHHSYSAPERIRKSGPFSGIQGGTAPSYHAAKAGTGLCAATKTGNPATASTQAGAGTYPAAQERAGV